MKQLLDGEKTVKKSKTHYKNQIRGVNELNNAVDKLHGCWKAIHGDSIQQKMARMGECWKNNVEGKKSESSGTKFDKSKVETAVSHLQKCWQSFHGLQAETGVTVTNGGETHYSTKSESITERRSDIKKRLSDLEVCFNEAKQATDEAEAEADE